MTKNLQAGTAPGPNEPFEVEAGKPVPYGENHEPLSISVSEDSRCPTGVTCVWAGQAKLQITWGTGESAKTAELVVPGMSDDVKVSAPLGDFTVECTALNPYPSEGQQRPITYTARLTIHPKKS